jgi:hypothetical protein
LTTKSDAFLKAFLESQRAMLRHYEYVDKRDTVVDGNPAIQVDGLLKPSGKDADNPDDADKNLIRIRQVIVRNCGNAIVFSIASDADHFDVVKDAMIKLIATVHLSAPKAPTSAPTTQVANDPRGAQPAGAAPIKTVRSLEYHVQFNWPPDAASKGAPRDDDTDTHKSLLLCALKNPARSHMREGPPMRVSIDPPPPPDGDKKAVDIQADRVAQGISGTAQSVEILKTEHRVLDGKTVVILSMQGRKNDIPVHFHVMVAVEYNHSYGLDVFNADDQDESARAAFERPLRSWKWID